MVSRRRDGPRRRSERRLRGHRGVSPPRPFVAGDLARRSGWHGAETEVLSIRTDEVRGDSAPHLPDRIHRRSRIRDLGRARTGRGAVGRRPGEGPGTGHHTRGDARARHRPDGSGAQSGGGRVDARGYGNHRVGTASGARDGRGETVLRTGEKEGLNLAAIPLSSPRLRSAPMASMDAVIVGGGHNGLVAAAYLAKAGLRVLVLERRSIVGGACVTEEIHPGFRASTLAYTCGLLRPEIKADLDLSLFGLEEHAYDPSLFQPFPDGRFLLYRNEEDWNRKEMAKFSKKDAAAWPRYSRFWDGFAELVEPTLLAPPVSLADLVSFVRTPEAEDFLRRIIFTSIADMLDEFFESDEVKASLATSAVAGTMAGPRTPGTAFVLGHHTLGNIGGVNGVWGWSRGGMGGISEAIARAARHYGAQIRTNADVARILTREGRTVGVLLADGTQVDARAVLSNADPKRTFLRLLRSEDLPVEFVRAISRIRFESSSFKLNLALRELPDFRAVPGKTAQPHHKTIIDLAPSMDYLERAYDDAKRGHPSREPFLELVIESANDPTVAPPGMHSLTVSAKFAPFDLASGSWDTEARVFADRIVELLEQYAPNIRRAVVAMHWRSPLTMEQEYGLTRGDVFHGAILPYQMFSFRPVPGWSSYRTPVRGLYLCGAGAHPGGGVMGAAGHNAAMAVLEDWSELRSA